MTTALKRKFKKIHFASVGKGDKLILPGIDEQVKFYTTNKLNTIDFVFDIIGRFSEGEIFISNSAIDKKGSKGIRKISELDNWDINIQIDVREEERKKEIVTDLKDLKLNLFRHHTKIIIIKADDNFFTLEGSGNISTNAEVEQYSLSNHKESYNFHKKWILEMFENPLEELPKQEEKPKAEPTFKLPKVTTVSKKTLNAISERNIQPSYTDESFFHDILERRPTQQRNITIDEFVETVTIPSGKLKGNKYSLRRTPYLKKPLWYMSPQCDIQELYLMFSAQTSKTSTADIVSTYYTHIVPSEIIFAAKEAGAARKWAQKRYVPMCNKLGVEFRTSIEDKQSRASGNTMFTKEFDGGNIDIVTSGSSSQLASETKRVALADEISRWKEDLNGEGSPLDLLQARLKQWGDQGKFLGISTPHLEGDLIDRNYKRGTQEHFHIKCPLGCGAVYPLEWMTEGGSDGFTYETTGGRLDDVFYICPKCKNVFKESKKTQFLLSGVWTPHATPDDPSVASMYLNVLYSPFEDWHTVARKEIAAQEDPMKQIAFTNLYKGLPHKELGFRPDSDYIAQKNSFQNLKQGDIPNDMLFLSFGADIQRGKEMYQKMTDEEIEKEIEGFHAVRKDPWKQGLPRIELLLLGTSWLWKTHGVSYHVFYGRTDDPNGGAFEKLRNWILENKLTFKRVDGTKIFCTIGLVDSGDGEGMHQVYNFCESYPGGSIYPCKGNGNMPAEVRQEKGDKIQASSFNRVRESATGNSKPMLVVSTNYYKSSIYANLAIPRQDGEQRPGFVSFPDNMPDRFYKMLTAEEKLPNGTFLQNNRRNEALDVMVYARAGSDYYIQKMVKNLQEQKIKLGLSRLRARKEINTRSLIDKMRKDLEKAQKKN